MTRNRVILIAGAAAVLLVLATVAVTVSVVGGGGGSETGGGGGEAGEGPAEPTDINGAWRFVVALEEDESDLLSEEMVVHMDLMRNADGSLGGRGTAEYGFGSYVVEVREGQVSQDGRLYLRLGGADDEGDDLLDFELYDDGGEDVGVSGSADGSAYFEPPDDPYGVGKADAVSFTGEAAGGEPPDVSGVWEGEVQTPDMGAGTLTLDLEQDVEGGLSGEIGLSPEGAPSGSTPVSDGSFVDDGGFFVVRNSEEPEVSISGRVEGEAMDAEFLIEQADGTVPYDAKRE